MSDIMRKKIERERERKSRDYLHHPLLHHADNCSFSIDVRMHIDCRVFPRQLYKRATKNEQATKKNNKTFGMHLTFLGTRS